MCNFEYGKRRSCQWLVSSTGRPSIHQDLSSFPTVHWPWVPGIDFLWYRTERCRYHTAPAAACDQEQIPEIPMRWWWITSLCRPSILDYRNQGDTCTEFIIIQATDVSKTGCSVTWWTKLLHGYKQTRAHSWVPALTSAKSRNGVLPPSTHPGQPSCFLWGTCD